MYFHDSNSASPYRTKRLVLDSIKWLVDTNLDMNLPTCKSPRNISTQNKVMCLSPLDTKVGGFHSHSDMV